MRTFDGATYRRIQEAWRGFGPEWRELRLIAAERGYPLPPKGDATDDREDPEPSQRSICYRALDFRRTSTLGLARRSRSWGELVGRIVAEENGIRELVQLDEREAAWHREQQPSARQATETLGAIVSRIADSVGATR